METVICNLSGKSRRETLNGREHIVVPVTLIVPGVLNGSRGPLYYPEDEIQKNVESWNGIPLTLDHPKDQSARSPEVLNRQGMGFLFNAKYAGKLTGEAWFDTERTRAIDPRVLASVEQGNPIEVSTGLFTESEPAPEGSVDNKGRAYSFIARNYKPDHLAILPDSIGACSIKDGCGVLVNEDEQKTFFTKLAEFFKGGQTPPSHNTSKEPDMAKKETVDYLIANCDCYEESDRDTLNEMCEQKLEKLMTQMKKMKQSEQVANAAKQGFQDQQGDSHKFNAETGQWEHIPAATKNKSADEPKPLTKAEWLAQAPPEIRATLNHAEQIEQREREQLIAQITANVQDKDRLTARLKDKPLDELRDLALLAPQKPEPRPSYLGASIPTGNQLTPEEADDHLEMPTINWAEAAKTA